MKIRRLAAVCLVAFSLLAGPSRAGEKAILRVFAWSSFFAPEVLESFEDEFDCIVAIDQFDSNEEMYEAVRTGGRDYDVITPSAYMSTLMRKSGLLRAIDHSLIPNLRNLDCSGVLQSPDPEMAYSVPYTRTVSGVGYNTGVLRDVDESWAIFADRTHAGRMTMLDDMRETLGAALKYLGRSLNTARREEIEEAGRLVAQWKKNLARFEVDQANIGLASGELAVAHAYNGDVALLQETAPGIGFFVPREGAAVTVDDLVVPARAGNAKLAHAFINHLLDEENAAANMEGILYYMPVPGALKKLPEDLRNNPAFAVSEKTLARCEQIMDVGSALAIYQSVWEAATSGK